MTFLGSRPDSFGYSSTSYDHFSGNAVTTTFNLSRSVTTESDIEVIVNNVVQDPGVAYLVSNLNTLTFTSPPSAAYPNNIVVVYRNFVNSGVSPAANTVTSAQIATGAIQYYHLATGLFNPVVTNFTGNGSNTSFTLSQTPPAANGVSVTVNGITQTSPANYSISGNNLVFTSAPANGAAIRAAQQSISVGLVPLDNSVTTSKIQAGAVTSAQIVSVANTQISGNIISSQITSIANTQITGTITNNVSSILANVTTANVTTLSFADGSTQTSHAAPNVTVYTSGSGTYTVPTNAKYLTVLMVGGGGGGGGGSTTLGTGSGSAGSNTTFGTSLLLCTYGSGGVGSAYYGGGAGGTATINLPATGYALAGGTGGAGTYLGTTYVAGGSGGNNPLAGNGQQGGANGTGYAGVPNTGSGGGGAGSNSTGYSGAGGGAGGYINAIISSANTTYSYSVGTGGAGGTATTTGGAGASGIIVVTAYF